MQPISCARHQFPPDIIRHAVWLYLRFTLSYQMSRSSWPSAGLDIIRRWVLGPAFARNEPRIARSEYWTFSCSRAETELPPSGSCASS
jgi:putative transposase